MRKTYTKVIAIPNSWHMDNQEYTRCYTRAEVTLPSHKLSNTMPEVYRYF